MGLTSSEIKSISRRINYHLDETGKIIGKNHGVRDDMFLEYHKYPVDGKIGKHFDAHGIAKGSFEEQIETLDNFLENGINPDKPFHTAPYEIPNDERALLGAAFGTSSGTAYKNGLFVLVGQIDKLITQGGIKYVAVNVPLYEHIEKLQKAYPNVTFVPMKEMGKVLTDEYKKAYPRNDNKIHQDYKNLLINCFVYYDKQDNKLLFQFKDDETKLRVYQDIKDVFADRSEIVKKNGRLYFAVVPTDKELKEITEEYNRNKSVLRQGNVLTGKRVYLPKNGGR